MDAQVFALVASGTTLYAGGFFGTAGGVPAIGVAAWNGSAWSALGLGVDGELTYSDPFPLVGTLAVSGTTLYAGGNFKTAGGTNANGVAKWNGGAWSALGAGVTSGLYGATVYGATVYALAADSAGHLFVGGDFSIAGTNISPYIAEADLSAADSVSGGQFGSLVYSATGFGCTFSNATIGQPYHIQSCRTLSGGSWTNLTNFIYNGQIVVSDPSAADGLNRFYRAVSP
jgi:hypothetical protein